MSVHVQLDACARNLGIVSVDVAPGCAVVSMTVLPSMLNGHGTCHGGIVFTLADSAFAYACNADPEAAVAHHASITFLRPGRLGDCLRAEAQEVSRAGRTGVYDVTVTNQEGAVVAEFRGLSRTLKDRSVDRA